MRKPPETVLWKTVKLFQFRQFNLAERTSGPFRFSLDMPTNHWFSPPIVSGGMIVFVFNADSGYLYALDAATGKEIIVLKFSNIRLSAPAVRGSQVFFGDSKGVVRAFDIATRSEVWSFEEKGRPATRVTPLIDDELFYLNMHGLGLHAFDVATGNVRWMFKSEMVFGFAVGKDHVVLLTGSGTLICLDRKTGAKQWDTKVDSESLSPVIMGV